jgi:hypothetical protein
MTALKRMGFVTRHEITDEQKTLAKLAGYELVKLEDRDAFNFFLSEDEEKLDGISVVNAAAAVDVFRYGKDVGVFKNSNRDGEFKAIALKVFVFSSERDTFTVDLDGNILV